MSEIGPQWKFAEMPRLAISETAADATVVLPLGSTEQHGRHLPVSVDTCVVTALAEAAVERASHEVPILLLPTLPFGFAHHHLPLGGTVSLRSTTYVEVLVDIVTGLVGQGFGSVVLLNGHGGNEAAMRVAVDRLTYEDGLELQIAAASYWTIAADSVAALALDSSLIPGHAGHFETSLMLAISPELVQLADRPSDDVVRQPISSTGAEPGVVRRPGQWERSDGRTDDAAQASVTLGEQAMVTMSANIAEYLVEFHRSGRSPASSLGTVAEPETPGA